MAPIKKSTAKAKSGVTTRSMAKQRHNDIVAAIVKGDKYKSMNVSVCKCCQGSDRPLDELDHYYMCDCDVGQTAFFCHMENVHHVAEFCVCYACFIEALPEELPKFKRRKIRY